MTQLKPITIAGVPAALQKAERYRLLNGSPAAESICRDILQIEPENQSAPVTLLLSIPDQFLEELPDGVHRARPSAGTNYASARANRPIPLSCA